MAHTLLSRMIGTAGQVWFKRSVLAVIAIAPIILIFGHSVIVIGQPDTIYRLNEGTRIKLKLDAEVTSKAASVNDTFICFVAEPVAVRDAVVLPAGSVVEGRVTAVKHAGYAGRDGRLEVVFETLRFSGETRRIDGLLVSSPRHSAKGFGMWGVLGGAAGVASGGAFALFKRGKDARLRPDEEIEIELRSPVVLPVPDY